MKRRAGYKAMCKDRFAGPATGIRAQPPTRRDATRCGSRYLGTNCAEPALGQRSCSESLLLLVLTSLNSSSRLRHSPRFPTWSLDSSVRPLVVTMQPQATSHSQNTSAHCGTRPLRAHSRSARRIRYRRVRSRGNGGDSMKQARWIMLTRLSQRYVYPVGPLPAEPF